MKVELLDINRIKPYENNPRVNNIAVEAVANSIKEFGFQQPIVVDKDHVIIAGHTRYKAAQELDLNKVPVVIAENLTKDQIRAYRIADNKLNQLSEWDFELLKDELQCLNDNNFGLSVLGFDESELDNIMNGWSVDFELPTSNLQDDSDEGKIVIKCNKDDKEDIINFIGSELKKKGYTGYDIT